MRPSACCQPVGPGKQARPCACPPPCPAAAPKSADAAQGLRPDPPGRPRVERCRHEAAPVSPPPPCRATAVRAAAGCWSAGCLRAPSVRRSETPRHWPNPDRPPQSISKIGPGVVPPGTHKLARPSRRRNPPSSTRDDVGQRQHHHVAVGIFAKFHSLDLPPAPAVAVHQHQRILGPDEPGS